MPKKLLTGIIDSDKMNKTHEDNVDMLKTHTKKKRRYRSHKRYKAHDESNEYKVNEKVVIEEANPMSKDKQWKIIRRAS